MKTIILLRHSKPQKNSNLPNALIPLSDQGIDSARTFFQSEIFTDIAQVFCSPYKRAQDTATLFGLSINTDARLRERELGDHSTLNAEFWERQYEDSNFKNTGGESFNEVRARMTAAFSDILTSMRECEKVVVVSHAAAICAYLQNFCTISVLDSSKKMRKIVFYDNTILSGKIDTPSAFVIEYEDNQVCNIFYQEIPGDCHVASPLAMT